LGAIGSEFNNLIAEALRLLNAGFVSLGLDFPFLSSWALTIIFFTLVIKLITLPLTFKQLHSARATARLQPELKALQKQYGKDREGMARAQQELYKANGVNPLSGCLPSVIQMPVWIGLYSALYLLANNQDFANSHFFWISNLAWTELHNLTGNPTAGAEAIFHWLPYIPVLALLTGITGWVTQKMMTMPNTDPNQQQMQSMMQFMPLMFVFFSLSVPAGLVLYWVANNVFTMASQWVLQKWGGLDNHPPVVPATALAAAANGKTTNGTGKGGATPKNRAAAVVRGDSQDGVDGAEKEPVRNALPQAAPGARKRRRRSK
jgi:YidC/Oxa1 family membrane protein insertase